MGADFLSFCCFVNMDCQTKYFWKKGSLLYNQYKCMFLCIGFSSEYSWILHLELKFNPWNSETFCFTLKWDVPLATGTFQLQLGRFSLKWDVSLWGETFHLQLGRFSSNWNVSVWSETELGVSLQISVPASCFIMKRVNALPIYNSLESPCIVVFRHWIVMPLLCWQQLIS